MLKRLLALMLALLLLLSLVACDTKEDPDPDEGSTPDTSLENEGGASNGDPDPEPAGETIDIYLIAGQSNAVGHTKVTDRQAIFAEYPELENGYSNILYAGNSRGDNGTKIVHRKFDWRRTKLGFGVSDSLHFGPEAGMAAALSEYYNAESGKYAGIIKLAHGGTGLLEGATSGSNQFGNWMPPSYANYIGASWDDGTAVGDIHGGLYRALLFEVESQIEKLLEDYDKVNFTKINIKGLYWMQGCNDRYRNLNDYSKAFQYFVSDLRRDLAASMVELTGSDCGAGEMAVFVGTISQTFSLGNAKTEADINIPFINMQKKFSERITNCYVVDNSQYAIGRWNTETNSLEVLGSDSAHWNQADMLDIGVNVGNMMLEKCH